MATNDDLAHDVRCLILVLLVVYLYLLDQLGDRRMHDRTMDELCRMQYPECVIGVD